MNLHKVFEKHRVREGDVTLGGELTMPRTYGILLNRTFETYVISLTSHLNKVNNAS